MGEFAEAEEDFHLNDMDGFVQKKRFMAYLEWRDLCVTLCGQ
jgi:hypothetical protein